MVFRSRVLQSLATPSHSMHISARAARIQMRARGVRGFAPWPAGRCPVAGEPEAAMIGAAGGVVSRLRAGSRATTTPAGPATPSVVAALIPALAALAPASPAMTPPTENEAWKADITGRL